MENDIAIKQIPITTNGFRWTFTSNLLFIFLHVFSLVMPTAMILTFFSFAMDSNFLHWRIIFFFIDVLAWWGAYLLISLLLGKLLLILLKLIHTPREGLFKIEKKNKDYSHFCLRITLKKYIFWIWNNFCFPWANVIAFKLCDIKADFKSTMFDGWSDMEFIEYGNNVMIGQGAQILSSIIIKIENIEYLLIKKVIIGDHVVLGAYSIVTPGTIIGKGTTLGVWTVTRTNQVLEPDWIYVGKPAKKYQPAQKSIADSKKQPMRRFVDTGERIIFDIEQFSNK
ncbi:MAG: acyltransferase [Candidatus Thorarchaeota archaeon]